MLKKLFGSKDKGPKTFKRNLVSMNGVIEKHGEAAALDPLPFQIRALVKMFIDQGKKVYSFTKPIIFKYSCRVCHKNTDHFVLFVHRQWGNQPPAREAIIQCKNCGTIIGDEPLDKLGIEIRDDRGTPL